MTSEEEPHTLKILAVADVHSPKYLDEFTKNLENTQTPDLILFGGDMINFGKEEEYRRILNAISSRFGVRIPIYACFGNEEVNEIRNKIERITQNSINFLEDARVVIETDELMLGMIGISTITGITDRFGPSNHEEIRKVFETRAERIRKVLHETVQYVDKTIVLTHYSPLNESSSDTLNLSWWASKIFRDDKPDFVIHGHLHQQTTTDTMIDGIRIINVAYPARGNITEFVV
jgi:Icc-related predicted phosphoesterase